MLIILEGPDCAGKTTLVSEIQHRLVVKNPGCTVDVYHRGPIREHPLDEYVVPLLHYRPGQNHHVICDRWHLGEVVYPRILQRPTVMDDGLFSYVEAFLEARGAHCVVLTPPEDLLADRYMRRGDWLLSWDQIKNARLGFKNVSHQSRISTLRSVDTADQIIWRAEGCETRALRGHTFLTPVGSNVPHVILFGDVRNGQHREGYGTAFMPFPSTSGAFLLRALDQLPVGWMLANACDVDDPVRIVQRYATPATKIVAFGANAHSMLASKGIPHASLPHPQYVRRFHHAAYAEYGKLIRDLAEDGKRNELKWRPSKPQPASRSISV